MNAKTTVLFTLLLPGIISLAACDRSDNEVDDAATPTTEAMVDESADMDAMPAETMPGEDAPVMDTGMSFAQMDANGDGGVTLDELPPTEMLHAHFSVADADNDGVLTEAEVTQHRADMAADEPRQ